LGVVQLIHDNKTDDTYTLNDPEGKKSCGITLESYANIYDVQPANSTSTSTPCPIVASNCCKTMSLKNRLDLLHLE